MKLDVSVIKWRKEIEKRRKEIDKMISEEINNRWNELEYTWSVETPIVGTTNITTTTNNTYDGGTGGNFYWTNYSPYLTTLSSSPF